MIMIQSMWPERTLSIDAPYGHEHRARCAKRTCLPRGARFSRNGSYA